MDTNKHALELENKQHKQPNASIKKISENSCLFVVKNNS